MKRPVKVHNFQHRHLYGKFIELYDKGDENINDKNPQELKRKLMK